MEKEKFTSLHSTFSINNEISDEDTRFLGITIDVMHTGLNLNGSYFDKNVVNENIESIKNTSVLGFIKYNELFKENDFKGHEYILKRTENGVEEKYIGSAYGVIPESCNPRWTTKMCSDGVEREFLQVDAILWTKFEDSTSIVERDKEKSQSMELELSSIDGYEDENEVFHFTKFRFDGCCMLGEGVCPAMVDANVKIKEVQFAMKDFIKNVQCELNDKFTKFTKLVDDNTNQGGIEIMPNTDFSQTVMEQFQDISNLVRQYETVEDMWGYNVPRYYLVDIQDDEVIVVDRSSNYNYFGFMFTVNGDKPEINFENAKRKKTRFVDYEDGEKAPEDVFSFGKHISEIETSAFGKVEKAEADVVIANEEKIKFEEDYKKVLGEYEDMKPKFDQYVEAEEQRIAEELNAEKENVFSEYEDMLFENVDFNALKERKEELTASEIEKECALMYVKESRKKSFSAHTKDTVTLMEEENVIPDGYVKHKKYGLIRKTEK